MEGVPTFVSEDAIEAVVQGGRSFYRLYAWLGSSAPPERNSVSVLYNASEMVLTDFRGNRALSRARDPQKRAAEDCDNFVRDTFGGH